MYSREERMKAVKLYFQYDGQMPPYCESWVTLRGVPSDGGSLSLRRPVTCMPDTDVSGIPQSTAKPKNERLSTTI